MKVVYVMRTLAHFSYHESTIKHLCNKGHTVHVLSDKERNKGYSERAAQTCLVNTPGLTFDWAIRRNDLWRRPLFASREILSYASYLVRKDRSVFLDVQQRLLPNKMRKIVCKFKFFRALLASNSTQSLLRIFERLIPPDPAISEWLIRNRPDVVVASPINMYFSEEVEYIKAAKAIGIPTVVPVLSWDNLLVRGLYYIVPDLTLAWNQSHFNQAATIHRIPIDKIMITGAPFFDKWFEAERLYLNRHSFCNKVGLDPDEPFLVYLGSSTNIAGDETWLVREFVRCLRRHPNLEIKRINILVRPHPANVRFYEHFEEERVYIWPKEGALPDSDASLQDFYNTLQHCFAVIGVNTSGMIDAVINEKPCVTIMTEQYKSSQLLAEHFQDLLNAEVLEIAKSVEECGDIIESLWRGLDSKQALRRQFVREFIRPHGIEKPAGAVAAEAIELVALGVNPKQKDMNIPRIETSEEMVVDIT